MINAIAPWYGSNRMLAPKVGELLSGCKWVGIPCGGSMCELKYIDARTVLVSDLHRHVINLAAVIRQDSLRARMIQYLDSVPFHPDILQDAQARCVERERTGQEYRKGSPDFYWAVDYFIAAWMSRNGSAGTATEFDAGLSVRWTANGGDSAVRFHNAGQSLDEWGKLLHRCTFVCEDFFDFLGKVKDEEGHGLYVDLPFPGPGDKYKFRFTPEQHAVAAERLLEFREARVVCRFYECDEIHQLYKEGEDWDYIRLEGRKQTNETAPEILIVRK